MIKYDNLNWFNKALSKAVSGIYRLVFHLDKEQAQLFTLSMINLKTKKGDDKKNGNNK